MNQLENMQIFVRVAELASFTQAADSMGMPKASVSTAVQQLEGHLGSRLLHRTTRKVQLTQDGQAFYERCIDVLADMDELQAMFQHGEQDLTGRLRVDMSTGTARHLVVPRLPEFLSAHPHVQLELSCTDRKVDVVREGFDCVLRVGSIGDVGLIARPLGRFQMVNCASPAYLATRGVPQSLDDLAHHQLIHYTLSLGSKPIGWEYVAHGVEHRLAMPGALTVNSAVTYQSACLAGLGLIQVPLIGVQSFLDSGVLVSVLPQYQAEPLSVTLLYANRRHLPKRVQVFMNWLSDCLTPHLMPNQAPQPS